MTAQASPAATTKPPLAMASLAALGVVFGDIGTSPLYTLKTVLDLLGTPDRGAVLGALSLIVWTLIIITTIKYVGFAMRVDNDGEGGILALMALLGVKRQHRPAIVAVGLFGAALIYGDGAITPAISVLSALEGLDLAIPAIKDYVLPLAVVVLLALFLVQPQGTARIGRLFGPVMVLWFLAMAALGLWGLLRHPSVVVALNPLVAAGFLFRGGSAAFVVLGGVFLCVTGAEALYADMGQFGARPIKIAWSFIVFPSLILNYAGQAAIVMDGAPIEGNIFYRLCPPALLLPLIVLSTLATVIASQSIITGAFSMTRQAIQLGWMPRLKITQTSKEGFGQIYVGAVNWILMLVTLGLTVGFKKSDHLAAAYGIAVSATMLMTSGLLYIAMREIWQWSLAAAGAVAAAFLVVDAAFFASNMTKVLDGGYVPLLLAGAVYLLMYVWHRGTALLAAAMTANPLPLDDFLKQIAQQGIARVPGTAVFLTRALKDTPPVVYWHVKQNRALHRHVIALTILVEQVPRVPPQRRVEVQEIGDGFWRATAHYGFMQRPDIPRLIGQVRGAGCPLDPDDVTYYVGHETVTARKDRAGLPWWQEALFEAMQRNASHVTDFFSLPSERVVEIGRQVSI
ncbi:MAG TPA: KUP/HAK/KT family potassium transporter [Burkholderiaceae bacterium]|nr:KUP/HAK/KT family potassium transporter [Burkholderiaceae bacterium]